MVVLAVGSVRYGRLPNVVHTVYIAIVLHKASFISLLAFIIKLIYVCYVLSSFHHFENYSVIVHRIEMYSVIVHGIEICSFQYFMHRFHLHIFTCNRNGCKIFVHQYTSL